MSSELDGNVVYKAFGGLKHGRFAMGNGVFKKTEVLAAVKHKKSGISGSTNSYNAVVRENAQLRHEVTEQRGMIREQRGMIQEQRGMLKVITTKLISDSFFFPSQKNPISKFNLHAYRQYMRSLEWTYLRRYFQGGSHKERYICFDKCLICCFNDLL